MDGHYLYAGLWAALRQKGEVRGLSQNFKTAYIGVGSNLGDRLANCLRAISLVQGIRDCYLEEKSDFFLTEPVGVDAQAWYVNGVISLSSGISARELLAELLAIEEHMGRQRKEKWAARPIDLDILLFGGDIIEDAGLKVPHPLMHVRRFVLVPMAQLAPDLIHPVQGLSMKDLLTRLPQKGQQVINAWP